MYSCVFAGVDVSVWSSGESCILQYLFFWMNSLSKLSIEWLQKTIYVEDAETAVKIIIKARDDARVRMQVMER